MIGRKELGTVLLFVSFSAVAVTYTLPSTFNNNNNKEREEKRKKKKKETMVEGSNERREEEIRVGWGRKKGRERGEGGSKK